jgi:hypothetical protein
LLPPDIDIRHVAWDLLRRRNDVVSVQEAGSDIRLSWNAERMSAVSGLEVEFIRTRSIRREDRAREFLAKRGDHPGLVCILSAMEPCSTCKPWHNKQFGKTYLVPYDGKCLHYYFCFVDEELPFTGLPEGHNWLAGRLSLAGELNIEWPTTPSHVSETDKRHKRSPMDGKRSELTNA